ncbi:MULTISPECIES: class I SAM-dependent methyltransferase [Halomonadaceae]|uniref:Methyltransferase domain-containing protein n=1 Tax=Vreelandella halophila TaxID=86177 RepID=A0A9X4Y7S1_9GAMM|nr:MULTISPECIES: methyltransferase domain-containing protein [Halomonas]MYL25267.1 methyltransferase domain-containing protein [Halomonas utahensis]MYL75329.1 methyltransferase domain-containing protein [Halomonas sp. 22501_18_FS]
MTDDFYRAFEEKYRGSREDIQEKLSAYQPFLLPFLKIWECPSAVDFGCGRGEWLEYLSNLGFSASGVDLDEGMLAACQELQLRAEKGDMIEYIRGLPDESEVVLSAFHVVEHISFDDLRSFIDEAIRVLKPGGVLIMETPNPENIKVATYSFHFDPTHNKPIPPELLSFVAEYYGFHSTKTLRLHEPKDLSMGDDVSVQQWLEGVSPDYAIVAQKGGESSVLEHFRAAFGHEYGVSLNDLTSRLDNRLNALEDRTDKNIDISYRAEERARNAERKVNDAEKRAAEAEERVDAEQRKMEALKNSTSWRITAPLRFLSESRGQLRSLKESEKPALILRHALLYVNRRPRLKRIIEKILTLSPRLRTRLIRIAAAHRGSPVASEDIPPELAHLNPQARQIYQDLKAYSVEKDKERE